MNLELTEIAFVLDRSGSMSPQAQAARDGFNAFLAAQQAAPGRARLSVVLFDDRIELLAASLPIEEIVPLDKRTYVPNGSTALLDALGTTIDTLGASLAARPESERPGKVVVAVLTDGEENSSSRYTWPQISQRIRHQQEVYAWEFLFLGAGPDAIATAAKLQVPASSSGRYVADPIGTNASYEALSRKIAAGRAARTGHSTAEQAADAAASLESLAQEEDAKRRPEE